MLIIELNTQHDLLATTGIQATISSVGGPKPSNERQGVTPKNIK